ncbi:hypothetical protein [Kitasatospora sp. NPDC088548]|uniref:hypothetical protein n=1 Tax=Kitasatospora sp. NPDC088548 TaxID=3364075 RepID=UPI003818BD35
MTRINVFDYGNDDVEEPKLAGWFDDDSAVFFREAGEWDGSNRISDTPVVLYRTKGGRWVRNTYSQRQGVEERYEFVTDEQARDWLIRNKHHEHVARYFGELEEEAGPNLGGRPKIGEKKSEVRLPDKVLAAIDDQAKGKGVTRAELLRTLIARGWQHPPYQALADDQDLRRVLREADEYLDGYKDTATDPREAVEKRVFCGTGYHHFESTMRKALTAAVEHLAAEKLAAGHAYAEAEGSEPETSAALAEAWGRSMGLDTVTWMLESLRGMLPMGTYYVMDRANLDDPGEDLDA